MFLRWIGFLCAVAGLLSPRAFAAEPVTPQTTWRRMMDAYGGEQRMRDLLTAKMVRRMSGDVEGLSTTWIKEDPQHTSLRMKEVFDNGIGQRITIDGPEGSWTLDPNGFVRQPDAGGPRQEMLDLFLSEVPFSLLGVPSLTLLAVQDTAAGAMPVRQLIVSFAGEERATLSLDPGTHFLTQATWTRDEGAYQVSFRHHRTVDGVVLPFEVEVSAPQGRSHTTTLLSAALGVDIPDDIFKRPASWPTTLRWPEGQDRVSLPAAVGRNGQVMITLTLPNRITPILCLLDSGAAGSVLRPDTVAHLSLATAVVGRVQGVGSTHPLVYEAKLPEARIGAITLVNRLMAVNDSGTPFDGILGYDFFRGHVLAISYRDGTVTAVRPERYRPPAHAITMTLSLARQLPTIVTRVNGVRATLAVDFGFNGELALFRPFVREHRWTEQRGGQARGAGGIEETGMVAVTLFQLGQTSWPALTALVVEGASYPDGLMGAALFLRLAEVHFDYEHLLLHLVPKPWLGVRFDARSMTVAGFVPGSPAESAGLLPGDQLLTIDQDPVKSFPAFQKKLLTYAPGDKVILGVRRGTETLRVPVTLTSSFQ